MSLDSSSTRILTPGGYLSTAVLRPQQSWVEISAAALEHNLASYKQIAKPALFAAVIKSNAYGHGLDVVGELCDRSEHVDWLFVVNLDEALYLRSRGVRKPILVLSIVVGDIEQAIIHNISLVLYDLTLAYEFNACAQRLNKSVGVHIKVDTGLSRLGLYPDDALVLAEHVAAMPFMRLEGLFTHFANSEQEDQSFVTEQLNRFTKLIAQIESRGISIPLKHTSCSAATTVSKHCHFNLVRTGIGIYGLWPSNENQQMTAEKYPNFSLRPVLTWKTIIIQIKDIPAGSSVGYDRTFSTSHPMKIAILPVGYWDGYDRQLSNNGSVMINGQYARVLGRIAMNLMMVDVTHIAAIVGDQVTLMGNYPGITADDLAHQCDTINYEVVTRINPLIKRLVI